MAKILITGRPGVGKTTVIRKVVQGGLRLAGGFMTEEMRQEGERVGFRVQDLYSGQEGVLARAGRGGGPRVGRYVVDVASFEGVGVRALRDAMARAGLVVIDEIGRMELCSGAFREAVSEVMRSDRDVLATVPAHRDPFLDALPARILEMLGGSQPG